MIKYLINNNNNNDINRIINLKSRFPLFQKYGCLFLEVKSEIREETGLIITLGGN